MQILKLRLEQIQIPPYRQRGELDGQALAELMASIEAHGLLQPIVVRAATRLAPDESWPEGETTYTLVAGMRRLSALANLAGLGQATKCCGVEVPAGWAAAVSLGDLDQLAAEEAELEENIRRVDLSWQERATATARLAKLRRERATSLGRPVPSMADIAKEVRGSAEGDAQENTRRELILAQALDNPEVAKAPSLKDAWKAHLRAEQTQRNIELGQSVGATFGAHSHTLIHGDSLEWIRTCPPEQFDVILTDPPYGIGAQDFGDAGGRLTSQTHGYDDSPEGWENLIGAFGSNWYRVAKPQAHLYVCCDIDGFHFARDWLTRVGWWVHRTPLINYKLDGSRVPWPEHGPQRKWELVLYAVKGRRPVTRIYSDVIETKGDPNLAHGAQKPVALFENLLKRSVVPGSYILDTFMGTGTTIVASHNLQCIATGIEQDSNYYGIAVQRVKELK